MNLIDLMQQHAAAEFAAQDWVAVAAKLNAKTVTVRDPTPVTYAMLTRDLGDEARALVAGTLRSIAKSDSPFAGEMQDAHTVLLNEKGGLTLHTDSRQAMIDQVASIGLWTDDLRDVREKRKEDLQPRFDAIVNKIGTVEHADGIAALRAMADELESV